jgi:PAS domain S-box-containing protein
MNILGKRIFSLPIRAQLLALVLLAVLPALLIILKNGIELKNSKIRETYDQSLYAVRTLAMQQEQIADSTKQILKTLALVPQVRNGEAQACEKLFQDLLSQNPAYLFINIANPAGRVIASSHPIKHSSMADRKHFQDAIKTKEYSVGEYVVSRDVHLPSLYFAYPIMDVAGHVRFVLTAALNLNVYSRFLSNNIHASNCVMGITDYRGVRLYRYPDTESDVTGVGVVISKTSLKNFASPAEEDIYEGVGSDGTYRLYAYKKLRLNSNSPIYGYVFFGAGREAILAESQNELYRNLMFLGLTLLLALAAAWGIGNLSIVDRLKKLKEAAHRLADGDLRARAGLPRGSDEISDLANSFDSMSTALEEKEKESRRAEKDVIESRQRLSEIIEFLPDATLVIDSESRVIAWNRAMEAMTGIKAEEMLGKGNHEYAVPFYGSRRPILIDLVLHWDSLQEKNYTTIRKCGDLLLGEAYTPGLPLGNRYLSATATVLRNADGEVTAAIECIRDETERKRLEKKLVESEREYRNLVGNTPGGVFRTHLDGRILFANQEFANILRYDSIEELMTRNAAQLYKYPESRKAFLDFIQRTGMAKNYEIELITKDGLARDIMLCAVMEGDIITGTLADITERKWAHDELKRYSEEISDLYDHAPCGYHSLDADGTFMRINGTELIWLGYDRDELIGKKKFGDLMTLESYKAFMSNYPLFKKRGWIKDAEYQLIRRDGTILPVILNATAIKDGEGDFLQSRASLFDNTERKRIEEERKGLEERLQRAEKMESLGMLAGGVAHDLNNVLGILIGYSELIDEEIDPSNPIRPHIKYIRQGGERAAAIVQDLLTLARRGVQAREVINLNTIIKDTEKSPECEKLLSFHPGLRIKTELDANLLNIKGSKVHLSKTLMNLISNAAEAMKGGGFLTVSSSNEYLDRPVHGYDDVQEGDYVVLTVSDTGEGISASDMKRIFEPFYTKKVMGRSGTGLGLSVVWGTVKDHKGYIDVESEEGKGTTFTLYFPVTREELSSEQTPISVSEYLGNGESVLIVDDVEGQRELAGRMLKKLNYEVMTASSGEEAVMHLRKSKVDIVVLDMIMDPGMDGLDTFKKILELHPKQKAIIVSGFSESDRVRNAQELGAGTYVKKPYVQERLGLAVKKELNKYK